LAARRAAHLAVQKAVVKAARLVYCSVAQTAAEKADSRAGGTAERLGQMKAAS
jgi:hypothetical protein